MAWHSHKRIYFWLQCLLRHFWTTQLTWALFSARTVCSKRRTSSACSAASTLPLLSLVCLSLTCRAHGTHPSSEERPGHSPKLYEYSSRGDIKEITSRHIEVYSFLAQCCSASVDRPLQFSGDKDSRGPRDFAGAAAAAANSDDEPDVEEDEAPAPTPTVPAKRPRVASASSSRAKTAPKAVGHES